MQIYTKYIDYTNYIDYICSMKKLIDINDSIIEDLKIAAVKKDASFKAYLENIISDHAEITSLANKILEDDQTYRALFNYITNTYAALQNHKVDDKLLFKDLTDFCKQLKKMCNEVVRINRK